MKSKLHRSIAAIIAVHFLIAIIFSACDKVYPDYPYNEIQSFSFKNANGEVIKGVITNGEIIVYWPENQPLPENINAEVRVSERATVSPASGTAVAFNGTTTFTVTAQDGSKTEYKLKPVVNYVKPTISGVNTSFFNGRRIVLQDNVVGHPVIQTELGVSGDFFKPDIPSSKVFLIRTDGSEAEGAVRQINTASVIISTDKIGIYKGIRLVNGGYSVKFDVDFEVLAPFIPFFTPSESEVFIDAKAGGELKLQGQVLDKVISLGIYDLDYNLVPLEIKEAESGEITVILPSNLPAGDYINGIEYQIKEDEDYLGAVDPSQPLFSGLVNVRVTD